MNVLKGKKCKLFSCLLVLHQNSSNTHLPTPAFFKNMKYLHFKNLKAIIGTAPKPKGEHIRVATTFKF